MHLKNVVSCIEQETLVFAHLLPMLTIPVIPHDVNKRAEPKMSLI